MGLDPEPTLPIIALVIATSGVVLKLGPPDITRSLVVAVERSLPNAPWRPLHAALQGHCPHNARAFAAACLPFNLGGVAPVTMGLTHP